MKIQRLLIVLTLVNLALLIFTLAQMHPAAAQGVTPVLRGRALEIVDDHGRVRASIQLLPPSTQKNGELSFAGLSLAGPSNTKDTYVILEAKGTASSLTLKNEDGREQIVKP